MADTIDLLLLPADGSESALTGSKRGIGVTVSTDAMTHAPSAADASEFEWIGSVEVGTDGG